MKGERRKEIYLCPYIRDCKLNVSLEWFLFHCRYYWKACVFYKEFLTDLGEKKPVPLSSIGNPRYIV